MLLVKRPVRSILTAIADAAARWSDADFPPRVRALGAVAARTGYSEPVVEYAFDRLFTSVTAPALETTIAGELGCIDALDGFVDLRGGLRARALPIGRVCVISSRTTIGVAIVPAIFALAAKCDVVVKDRDDHLVRAFFETLAQEHPDLREAARARTWSAADAVDLAEFDAVVAFGNDATIEQIYRSLPAATRTIGFGSKASAGYAGVQALHDEHAARDLARGAARDVVLYESEGCLSLHVLFVERGGAVSPGEFAALLAHAIQRAAIEFPPAQRDAAMAARLAAARDLAAFRAAGGDGAVYSDASASFLVVLDPPLDEPPNFLARAIGVISVDRPADARAYLRQHRVPIEALAGAPERADITDMAIAIGAARIARFGDLQAPPLAARHGGRPRIAEFVRWIVDRP
ncbi:MAG TPA: acyl-CoA reductase [Candidatus Baltobacteraceae bacterium]|nr:acyl-CoA reductase [Candidatus Baltobacteraceae bacterium]